METEALRQKLAEESQSRPAENRLLNELTKNITNRSKPHTKGLEALLKTFSEMPIHESSHGAEENPFLKKCHIYYFGCREKLAKIEYTLDDAVSMYEELNSDDNPGGFGIFTSAAINSKFSGKPLILNPKNGAVSHSLMNFGRFVNGEFSNRGEKSVNKNYSEAIVNGDVGDYAFLGAFKSKITVRGHAGDYLGADNYHTIIHAKSAGLKTGLQGRAYTRETINLERKPISVGKPYDSVIINERRTKKWKTFGFYMDWFEKAQPRTGLAERISDYANIGMMLSGSIFVAGGYLLPHEWLINYVNNSGFNGPILFQLGAWWYALNNLKPFTKKVLERYVRKRRTIYGKEFPDYTKYH